MSYCDGYDMGKKPVYSLERFALRSESMDRCTGHCYRPQEVKVTLVKDNLSKLIK